jgi:3,4-dihydroxy 2-butanone 4-phosphate synthase / GTP cyclohydrolase II
VSTVFDTIEDAIAAIARGEIVVVVDDESRENEGDLVMAAEFATPEAISFIVRQAAGMLCVAIPQSRADELALPLMVSELIDQHRTAFALSVDVIHGLTTGISPEERASTCRALANPRAVAADFIRPGHVNVLRARPGGVLQRSGHTEAAVDLARLAGLTAAGVICEVLSSDGVGMARRPELDAFAQEHSLKMISIADLIAWMREQGRGLIRRTGTGRIPTDAGDFTCHAYESAVDGLTHLALVYGDLGTVDAPLVRVHSECLTGDIFGSRRCDCGEQLQSAMHVIAEAGAGVVVYLRGHEGRGIGIANKLRAYELQDAGADTVDANLQLGLPVDSREYGVGAQILSDLGLTRIRLLSNNPKKRGGLEGYGLTVVEQVALVSEPNSENVRYLRTKRDRLGHEIGRIEVGQGAVLPYSALS